MRQKPPGSFRRGDPRGYMRRAARRGAYSAFRTAHRTRPRARAGGPRPGLVNRSPPPPRSGARSRATGTRGRAVDARAERRVGRRGGVDPRRERLARATAPKTPSPQSASSRWTRRRQLRAANGRAEIDVDVDGTRRDALVDAILREGEAIAARRNARWSSVVRNAVPPTRCRARRGRDGGGGDATRARVQAHGIPRTTIALRGGIRAHGDAFVPCREGWSHRPDEFAEPAHIKNGVEALARARGAPTRRWRARNRTG